MTRSQKMSTVLGDLGELLARHEDGRDLDQFTKYRDDPVAFIREVLDGEPWQAQREVAEAVRDRPQVTVRSCHAAGKDWLAARLSLWWVYARRGLVILTGPTAAQVEEILMRGEVRTAFVGSGLGGSLHVKALRPGGEGKAGILTRTATGVQGLQGWHDERVLFVVTEAQDPDIEHAWDAAFNCTTGAEDRKLMVGNPTEPGTRFHRAHDSADWYAVKIAADDIPNVREGRTVVPGLLTREGVERFASEYGRDSSVYLSRVEAEFPSEASDALVRREWIEAAVERWEDTYPGGEIVLGVDPARLGPDATAVCVRQGDYVKEFLTWRGLDTMETSNRIVRVLERCEDPKGARLRAVVIDEVGLGAGVRDGLGEKLADRTFRYREVRTDRRYRMRTMKPAAATVDVEGFSAGQSAHITDRFRNMKAQAYWKLRKELEAGRLALPPDEKLHEELLATRVRFGPDGRTEIEAKDALKSRIGRSPDRADALAISFAPELENPSAKRVRFR